MYSHVRKKSHLKHIHGIIKEKERKYKIIKKRRTRQRTNDSKKIKGSINPSLHMHIHIHIYIYIYLCMYMYMLGRPEIFLADE